MFGRGTLTRFLSVREYLFAEEPSSLSTCSLVACVFLSLEQDLDASYPFLRNLALWDDWEGSCQWISCRSRRRKEGDGFLLVVRWSFAALEQLPSPKSFTWSLLAVGMVPWYTPEIHKIFVFFFLFFVEAPHFIYKANLFFRVATACIHGGHNTQWYFHRNSAGARLWNANTSLLREIHQRPQLCHLVVLVQVCVLSTMYKQHYLYKPVSTHGRVFHLIPHVTATVPVAFLATEAVVSGQDQHTKEAPYFLRSYLWVR